MSIIGRLNERIRYVGARLSAGHDEYERGRLEGLIEALGIVQEHALEREREVMEIFGELRRLLRGEEDGE